MVFGISWMKKLGRVLIDYNKLTTEFIHEGKHTILSAENLLKTEPLSERHMKKLLDSSNIASLCQFQLVTDNDTASSSAIPQPVRDLLHQHTSVFQEPTALPPPRAIDHQIELQPGSKPVHVRPYKYPHF